MAKIKRIHLFSKLNKTSYQSLESATILCKTRGNPYVEIVHFINQIIMSENTDFHQIISHFELDFSVLSKDLIKYLDSLPRGASSIQNFSNDIELLIQEAWIFSSIVFAVDKIRTGHILLALKQNKNLSSRLENMSEEFIKINADLLQENFLNITKDSIEANQDEKSSKLSTGQADKLLNDKGLSDALSLYTLDLTQRAKEGKIDEIVGRDEEIRKMIDILMRRRQNNPILTGEAGVGKTALVEGLAVKLAKDEVPSFLKGFKLLSLDMTLLQAGASMKGEFEERFKNLIQSIQNSDSKIILFIDEAHSLIGAGGSAGQNDAANILKPALARGELRCIAATTWQEYTKYFEKDPALSRRFQNIAVDEPDDEKCIQMMRKMTSSLQDFHKVSISNEAIIASVKLTRRYLPTRKLPDKAMSILDTACARVALSQSSLPSNIENLIKEIEAKSLELELLQREEKEGFKHSEAIEKIKEDIKNLESKKAKLEDKFVKENELVAKYKSLREKILADEKEDLSSKEELKEILKDLYSLQEDDPMVLPFVDEQAIALVISEYTGIPLGRMLNTELKNILNLKEELCKNVIGQDHSLELIAKRIITSRAKLSDESKPQAIFMLAGPSGVGKTQTALSIAELVYGSENNIITINMSEFQEAHTVSSLKGAPPGYVGYSEGGILTEAVRKKPYSVILLDEIEKAHKDVHELFFQVFDKGRMEDGAGKLVDFRNTIIILTTNVGDEEIFNLCEDENNYPSAEILERAIREPMQKVFPPALLGRLVVVPYYPLSKKNLYKIIDLKLKKIQDRIRQNYKAELSYNDSLKDELISRCDNSAFGARMIDSIINNELLPDLSMNFLNSVMQNKKISKLSISARDSKFEYVFEYKED